jgi:histidine triad (HIT) family protein
MAELSPEQQQALDEQKAQCPFCKIVKGEIPSKKIFEDDKVLAVLDINPAAKGHILVMPKEHYPIMPLIPEDIFEYFFTKVKELSTTVREGAVCPSTTIFIANGAAAGQQSNHFMIHIIPRDENDGLTKLEPIAIDIDKEKEQETYNMIKNNLPIMLRQRYAKHALEDKPAPSQQPSPAPGGYTKEQIIEIIEKNPQIKKVIEEQPEAFKKQVVEVPQLQQLFHNVDVEEVIKHYKKEETHSIEELLELLDKNPNLKSMLLYQKNEFKIKISEIQQLKDLFGNVDLDELQNRVIEKEKFKEEQPEQKVTEETKEPVIETTFVEDKEASAPVEELSSEEIEKHEEDLLDALGGKKEEKEEKKKENIDEDKEEQKDEEKKENKEDVDEEKEQQEGRHGNPSLDNISNLF